MPASEAMPAIEDMRRLRVSHPANSPALCAERGAISIFDSLLGEKYSIMRGVLYHAISPYKTTGRSSGKAPARLTTERLRRTTMANCYCTQSYHDSQNWESPIPLKVYKTSCVIGGGK